MTRVVSVVPARDRTSAPARKAGVQRLESVRPSVVEAAQKTPTASHRTSAPANSATTRKKVSANRYADTAVEMDSALHLETVDVILATISTRRRGASPCAREDALMVDASSLVSAIAITGEKYTTSQLIK